MPDKSGIVQEGSSWGRIGMLKEIIDYSQIHSLLCAKPSTLIYIE